MTYNMSTSTLSTIPSIIDKYLPPSLHPFFLLSYPIYPKLSSSSTTRFLRSSSSSNLQMENGVDGILYDKGIKDIYLVISCAIIFTLLRSITMNYVFAPFANYIITRNKNLELLQSSPVKSKVKIKSIQYTEESKKEKKKRNHTITRFSEQAWSWLYCTVYWTIGMFTLYSVPNPTSPEQLWGTYPFTPLPALTKFYYLSQLGWWFHQLYVINCEKRRKDHWQMFGHHILSITLIVTSYLANFTRIGVVIHVLMDFCDIFLPLAKMLRYLQFTQACDMTFVIFLISWLFSREIGLFLVIKTSYFDAPKFIKFKWSPSTGQYLTYKTYISFIGLVSLLWILATVWFYMACRVAVKVVKGEGAEDSRSDDEDEIGNEIEDENDSIDLDDDDIKLLDQVPQSVGTTTNSITTNGYSNGHRDGIKLNGINHAWSNGSGELKKRK
ncbi:uncharacterized protein L201_000175 [Kwoniella dendrophila CBS 6074]|uniref:TLC domain-containing protein n=1 Tax=Kwoniella dendrophila CBS 6074 TaxID=1295534 RepID=A0AAX4JKA8_9TREE